MGIADRWIRRECVDLKVAVVWAAFLIVIVGHYHGTTETEPLAVQLVVVLPMVWFAVMLVADRIRRFTLWRAKREIA